MLKLSLNQRSPDKNEPTILLEEEFWKPPQSRFYTVDSWHSWWMHLRPFSNSQICKCRKICIGSWLPSESGFCPERRGSHNYSQPSSDLPFQLTLKEVISHPGSFCFPGGVLGRGALIRLRLWLSVLLVCCVVLLHSSRLYFRKERVALWCALRSGSQITENSEWWVYRCQAAVGVAKKSHMSATSQTYSLALDIDLIHS